MPKSASASMLGVVQESTGTVVSDQGPLVHMLSIQNLVWFSNNCKCSKCQTAKCLRFSTQAWHSCVELATKGRCLMKFRDKHVSLPGSEKEGL